MAPQVLEELVDRGVVPNDEQVAPAVRAHLVHRQRVLRIHEDQVLGREQADHFATCPLSPAQRGAAEPVERRKMGMRVWPDS